MAVGRKGSREILVDGVAYRWRLRRRPTYGQRLAWSPCTYAVERTDQPGSVLVVKTNHPHPSNWVGAMPKAVLPSGVARAIRLGLQRGWTPVCPGSPFPLDLSEGSTTSA
jgi:hypothetical protein